MAEVEEPLAGGNATSGGVVQRGNTVCTPWTAISHGVQAYLAALAARGVAHSASSATVQRILQSMPVPRHFGRDASGRQIIEFVPGSIAEGLGPLDDTCLRAVGRLIRDIHDASESFPFTPDAWDVLIPSPESPNLLCHNDLAPRNLVLGAHSMVFIDWDGAGPSTRLWDLAYAAQAFAMLAPPNEPADAAHRLRCFIDGYRPGDQLRRHLPLAIAHRTEAMYELLRTSAELGREPWASMFSSGHGDYWAAVARYAYCHQTDWQQALTPS